MNVSVKLVVTVGEGREKREFVVESHACADPLGSYDAGWMVPGVSEPGQSPSAAVAALCRQLGDAVTELVLRAEADSVIRWESTGLPERIE